MNSDSGTHDHSHWIDCGASHKDLPSGESCGMSLAHHEQRDSKPVDSYYKSSNSSLSLHVGGNAVGLLWPESN